MTLKNNLEYNQQIMKSKKKYKWKYLIFIFGFVLIISLISIPDYFNYKKEFEVQKEKDILEQAISENQISPESLKGLVNPRLKIRNSSLYEVIGLDHEGTLVAIGNISLNWTASNNNAGYGYFKYLGDSLRVVTKGWFDSINTSNITSTKWCNASSCFSTEQFTLDIDTDSVGQNDTWGSNSSNVYSVIDANGTIQRHDQILNATSNVQFNNITVTNNLTIGNTLFIPYNIKMCIANATNVCDSWILRNSSGVYIFGGTS